MTDQPPDNDEGQQIRPFAAVLQDINNGAVADQLARDVQNLVQAVQELGRKGKLTVTLEVAPRKGNAAALNLTARRDLKLPQEEPVESVFFADATGNLLRDDPRQMALPLRTVARQDPQADVRKAGHQPS
jgi:hypothetical protein